MGDMGEIFNDMKAERRERRRTHGIVCVRCVTKTPNRSPSILLPAQRCKVDGYVDPRPRDWEPLRGDSDDGQ